MYAFESATGALRWSVFGAAGPNNATCSAKPYCYCALDSTSTPVVDTEGNLYFGSMYGGSGGYLQSYDSNGHRRWQEDMGSWVLAHPAIGKDNIIYLGSSN